MPCGGNPLSTDLFLSYVRTVFEELEQIPWSELLQRPRRPSPWVVGALTVALGVLLIGLTVTRRPEPVDPGGGGGRVESGLQVDEGTAGASPGLADAVMTVSEEDLRAADSSDELVALTSAEVLLREAWSDAVYIEWAAPEDLTVLEPGLWSVRVAVQTIVVDQAGNPDRSEIQRLLVPVRVEEGVATLAGPISPVSHPVGTVRDAWTLEPAEVGTELASLVGSDLYGWSIASIEDVGSVGDLTRAEVQTIEGLVLAVWITDGRVLEYLPIPSQP